MNILYVGPYDSKDLNGVASRTLIKSLQKDENIKLNIKNIILAKDISSNNHTSIPSEDFSLDDTDVLIQHCPVDFLVDTHKIKKSIIIPIINDINNKDISILKLKHFDKLLVHNRYIFDKLKKIFGNKVVYLRYNDLGEETNQMFNLGFLNRAYKFYFLGKYSKDRNIINKIIAAFFLSFRNNITLSLNIFLSDDQKILEQAYKDLEIIKEKLKIFNNSKQVIFIPIKLDENTLKVIHNTGHIFIDNIGCYSNINCELAQFYKKKIIYLDRLDYMSDFLSENYDIGSTKPIFSSLLISEQMTKILQQNKFQYIIPESRCLTDILKKL